MKLKTVRFVKHDTKIPFGSVGEVVAVAGQGIKSTYLVSFNGNLFHCQSGEIEYYE